MKRFISTAVLLSGILAFSGCLVDKGELAELVVTQGFCDSLGATYANMMKPIIDQRCAQECHGAQSSNGDFTTYASMQAADVLNSTGVSARVLTNDINILMPLGNPMPDSVKAVFQCWANAGFPQQ